MIIQAVDLASRYSACVLIDETGQVLNQFDSMRGPRSRFVFKLVEPFTVQRSREDTPAVMGVEDLPHGVKFMTLIKDVCRLQGSIIDRMDFEGQLPLVLFVPPILWQTETPGIWRQGPEASVPVARELYGYEPPDLGKTAIARKVQTDYSSAYLIARWLLRQYQENGKFDRMAKDGKKTATSRPAEKW